MNKLLENLNKEQLEAATHKSGPMLVVAGAGTGKTTVITKRIAWLIEQKLAKPSEILALTYTEKAANEMDERIMELLPYGVFDFTAATFHSFCQDVLKDFGIIGGISPDFKLLTQSQQILFLRQNLDKLDLNLYKPITNPNKFLGALVKLFSRAKDENIQVDDYLKLSRDLKTKAQKSNDLELIENASMVTEQAKAYKTYELLKQENNYFDFGDLITKTLWLLKNRPSVLAKLQNKYKYIFVDEFQDTNYAQAQIIYLLAKKNNNLTVVGDDDQSIYKFRGASISNIMQFLDIYPKAKTVILTQNYRSTKQILDCSYNLIKNNNPNRLEIKENISKKLIGNIVGEEPQFWQFNNNLDETQTIIKKIIKDVQNNKVYSDFAILIRANSYADDFITILKDNGIPYHFVGSRGLYDREEIRELISYLKVLSNADDTTALFHVAWASQFKIDKILLRRLTNLSRQKNISLFSIFESICHSKTISHSDTENIIKEESREALNKIIDLVKNHLEVVNSWSTSKILIDYIFKSGMYDNFRDIKNYEALEKIENIRLFFRKISEFENISTNKSPFSFIEYLNLIIEAGDNPAVFEADKSEDAVNIMTIHQAKGLEFDTVFLPYLVHKRFPSSERKDPIELPENFVKETLPEGNIHLEEERRLFYVALTRAKKHLYLSASENYEGNTTKKKVSQFVAETLDKKNYHSFTKNNLDSFTEINNKPLNKKINNKQDEIKLSPSALETFETCPKKFEFAYIFNIKTEQNYSLSFGDSIHNTLRDCYNLIIDQKSHPEPQRGEGSLSNSKISAIYNKNWIDLGYISKQEMDRAYKKGLSAVINIIKNDSVIPNLIEHKFKLKIGNCKITGRIDRIDKLANEIEIIDYKTGSGAKKTKAEITKNLPLWIYAMAMKEVGYDNHDKIKLTLYYVTDNKKVSDEITFKKLENKMEKVSEICSDIEQAINLREFPAKPTNFNCQFCSYKSICNKKI